MPRSARLAALCLWLAVVSGNLGGDCPVAVHLCTVGRAGQKGQEGGEDDTRFVWRRGGARQADARRVWPYCNPCTRSLREVTAHTAPSAAHSFDAAARQCDARGIRHTTSSAQSGPRPYSAARAAPPACPAAPRAARRGCPAAQRAARPQCCARSRRLASAPRAQWSGCSCPLRRAKACTREERREGRRGGAAQSGGRSGARLGEGGAGRVRRPV